MLRPPRVLARVALVSVVAVPCFAWADALPPPNDIYYRCTAAEQCPTGSELCRALRGPAGQRPVDPECAARATEKKLEHRCWGKEGHLYCPSGTAEKPKENGKESLDDTKPAPKRGCW